MRERKYAFSSFNSQGYKPKADIERLRAEKREFLKEFSKKYGYNGKIDQIREEEYPQLRNEIYLDHTGATTFAKGAIINFHNDILNNLYGNPHSNSSSSQASSMRVEDVRKRILQYFSADEDEYTVIFTQNATAAIKMVGEMLPWSERSTYKYLRESHNSINGLRRFVETINPENLQSVTENDVKEMISNPPPIDDDDTDYNDDDDDDEITYNLFAYPAQCNFSGMRFPLNWVSKIKRLNTKKSKTLVLLDAAAYVPSAQISLADKDSSPDFICLSFYKMFGFPTGLGALILKSELNPILRKGYFGGGAVDSVVYDRTWQAFAKNLSQRYEDGTVNFLNIIALDHAFDAFERIYGNIKNVSNHVTSLNTYLSRNMRSLRHWNGQSVITINSDRDFSDSKKQGGIISFNVKRSDGSPLGYLELEKLASTHGIHIRSGGNCNPGSISRWNNIGAEEVIQNYSCSGDRDLYKGKLYGAARVSIGAMTTIEDVLIWLDFFKRYYVEVMPGRTVHDLGSSKINSSKFFKYMNNNKPNEDMNRNKSREGLKASIYRNESPSESYEDLRASTIFKQVKPRETTTLRHLSPSESYEDLRASATLNPLNPSKSRNELRASTTLRPSKSHKNLKSSTVLKNVGSSESHENLRASTIIRYVYGIPKQKDAITSKVI
jgi:molybdenum cofactor sulfurtransferase